MGFERRREIKIHYQTFSLVEKWKKNLFSARLDLLFVFSLDINPGRELKERKEQSCVCKTALSSQVRLFNLFILADRCYSSIEHSSDSFHAKTNAKAGILRLFKFNLKLNFQMKNAIFCAKRILIEMLNEDEIYGSKDESGKVCRENK